APVLLITGAAAYLQRDGALARIALTRAAEAGDLTMARLLLTALDGQVPPSEIRDVFATGAATSDAFG
ncbi:MAG: hypothetical protein JWM62_2992, partial [Frankiales bacterium]|nr:hypothetical protein [Frankiales bacterium]